MGTLQRNMARRIDAHGLQERSRRQLFETVEADGLRKSQYIRVRVDEAEKGWRVIDASGETVFDGTFKKCLELRVDGQTVEREIDRWHMQRKMKG